MTANPTHAYIGRCKCGEVISAAVDHPDHRNHIARQVSDWIRSGLTVERVTIEYVRESFNVDGCQCEKQGQLL